MDELKNMEIEEIVDLIYELTGNRLYTRDEVKRVMAGVTRSVQRGYTDNLIEDYI